MPINVVVSVFILFGAVRMSNYEGNTNFEIDYFDFMSLVCTLILGISLCLYIMSFGEYKVLEAWSMKDLVSKEKEMIL